ncbi:MAG: alpha/beta hydrolase [Terrimicrobiaceae bacterium]
MKSWHKRTGLGIGLGVGLAGALALGVRYGLRRSARQQIPDDLSPAIFARRLCTTSYGDMVYHVSGTGRPVVFLHGLYPGASSYEWSRIYPDFVLSNEVIAADLIGFGESERPAAALDADAHAESFADLLLEACSGVPATVVASGLTSSLALLMASRHPERVDRIVIVNPRIPRPGTRWATLGLRAAVSIGPVGRFLYDATLAREHSLRAWAQRAGYADPGRLGEDVLRNLLICAQQPGAGHAILHLLRGGLASDIAPRLPRVPHPVLILRPESEGAELGDIELLSEGLPACRVADIPACGLLAALEIPADLSRCIAQALEDISTAEGAA